jgi:hypothetical protein
VCGTGTAHTIAAIIKNMIQNAGTLVMILISEDCYGHPLAEIHQVCLEYLEKLSQMNSQDR